MSVLWKPALPSSPLDIVNMICGFSSEVPHWLDGYGERNKCSGNSWVTALEGTLSKVPLLQDGQERMKERHLGGGGVSPVPSRLREAALVLRLDSLLYTLKMGLRSKS